MNTETSFIDEFADPSLNLSYDSMSGAEKFLVVAYIMASRRVGVPIKAGLIQTRWPGSFLSTHYSPMFYPIAKKKKWVLSTGKGSLVVTREGERHFMSLIEQPVVPNASTVLNSDNEQKIRIALEAANPFFADAYRQILFDLADPVRVSFRGTVHEMRELLRALLNHFAPDGVVESQPGFSYENGQKKPTRTQKMTYILSLRRMTSAHIDPAIKSVSYLDSQVDALASIPSAVYGAGSESAHAYPRDLHEEVLRLKGYLDAILSDILTTSLKQ